MKEIAVLHTYLNDSIDNDLEVCHLILIEIRQAMSCGFTQKIVGLSLGENSLVIARTAQS